MTDPTADVEAKPPKLAAKAPAAPAPAAVEPDAEPVHAALAEIADFMPVAAIEHASYAAAVSDYRPIVESTEPEGE